MADFLPPTPAVPRKRRRPALACEQCRRRKVKCDRTYPCNQCVQSKTKTCTYAPQHISKSSGDHIERVPAFQDELASGSNPSSIALPNHPRHMPSPAPSSNQSPKTSNLHEHRAASNWSSPAADRISEAPPNVQALLDRVQKLETMLSKSTSSVNDEQQQCSANTESINRQDQLRGTLSKTRFLGQSHWMHSFVDIEKAACIKENSALDSRGDFNCEIAGTEVGRLFEQCKSLARAAKAGSRNEKLAKINVRDLVPSRKIGDQLVFAYFRTSEAEYRILHVPTFQKEYLQYWQAPSAASEGFVVEMLLVMACGTCFYQEADEFYVRSQARKWIFAAQSWLSALPFEKGRLSISLIQICCLVLVSRQLNDIVVDLMWLPTGDLIRMAFIMGLHRDPKHFPSMTVLQAELRRRIWATVMELNVQLSLDAGMNPLLQSEDFDTEPPANVNDEDLDETIRDHPYSRPSQTFTQTSLQILLLKSLPVRLKIVRLVNSFRPEPCYDDMLAMGAELTKFCKEGSQDMQRWVDQKTVGLTQLHRNSVDLSLRRFLLTLHRPWSVQAQTDPRYYFSRKVCLDSAVIMMTYPTNESGTPVILTASPQDDFDRIRVCTGGFLKGYMGRCIMIIFHELLQQLEEDVPRTEQGRCNREPLKKILQNCIDVAAARLQGTENNVKGHLFMSSILGQVEATEAGQSPYVGAMEAAKKSALFCSDLLAARIRMVQSRYGTQVKPPQETTEWRYGDSVILGQETAMDFDMGQWDVDFEVPDAWLLGGLDENTYWKEMQI